MRRSARIEPDKMMIGKVFSLFVVVAISVIACGSVLVPIVLVVEAIVVLLFGTAFALSLIHI